MDKTSSRFPAIDLLRGFIMILMALDHASAMNARVHFTEIWGINFDAYPSVYWGLTRMLSHLCAPGFFFLMGMSILLLAKKRQASNWTDGQIRKYFFKRGGFILLMMYFLEIPAWALSGFLSKVPSEMIMPGNYEGGFTLPTTVLYGLGACMMIAGFLWKLKDWQLLGISIGSFMLSAFYILKSSPDSYFNPLEHFIIVPGISNGGMSLYPIVPWIGVVCFGIFWANLLLRYPDKIVKYSLLTGVAFICLFLGIRFCEWGNFHHNQYNDFLTFFTLIKYPPSLVFILITCGINLVLLALFSKFDNKIVMKPVLVLGQTAMFFYIIHLWWFALLGIAFPHGCSFPILIMSWLFGLFVLSFICKIFLDFKKNKPKDSLWKMV